MKNLDVFNFATATVADVVYKVIPNHVLQYKTAEWLNPQVAPGLLNIGCSLYIAHREISALTSCPLDIVTHNDFETEEHFMSDF